VRREKEDPMRFSNIAIEIVRYIGAITALLGA